MSELFEAFLEFRVFALKKKLRKMWLFQVFLMPSNGRVAECNFAVYAENIQA